MVDCDRAAYWFDAYHFPLFLASRVGFNWPTYLPNICLATLVANVLPVA